LKFFEDPTSKEVAEGCSEVSGGAVASVAFYPAGYFFGPGGGSFSIASWK
jgi:hypothetical protein